MNAVVRNYANLDQRGSIIYGQELTDFPEDPVRNMSVMINGVLWTYTMIEGSLTWSPLNVKRNSKTHYQAVASADWNIQHGMGTQDFIIGVYDAANNLMNPASVTQVTDDSFHVTFTEPVIGRLVAFFNSELFAPKVTVQAVEADSINVGGGTVTADNSGLYVSGQKVSTLDSQGRADYGTL